MLSEFGIKKIGLFGSYAKGNPTTRSDIDLLVRLPKCFNVLEYLNLESKLKKKLGKEVEILEYRCIADYIKDSILGRSVVLYDQEQNANDWNT